MCVHAYVYIHVLVRVRVLCSSAQRQGSCILRKYEYVVFIYIRVYIYMYIFIFVYVCVREWECKSCAKMLTYIMQFVCRTYEWIVSHMWISRVTHTHEWVMSHISMSIVARRVNCASVWISWRILRISHGTHMIESCPHSHVIYYI